MTKPRLLDLFCGAGGCAVGYSRAGFDVTGVDIKSQPHYPFAFIQGDALEYCAAYGSEYDAIHASPPCQRYARIGAVHGRRLEHPDLVDAVRVLLVQSGRPWVLENVPDAYLPDAVVLCGSAFGLGAVGNDGTYRQLRRHRLFEANFAIMVSPCQHRGEPIGVYGNGGPQRAVRNRGYMGGRRERQEAMGIDWMDTRELSNAIPPAYTEYIGKYLMSEVQRLIVVS